MDPTAEAVLLEQLAALETSRDALHTALRNGLSNIHFARFLLSQRGGDVRFDAVPIDRNLQSRWVVAVNSNHIASNNSSKNQSQSNVLLELKERAAGEDVTAAAAASVSTSNETADKKAAVRLSVDSVEKEEQMAMRNPLYWFSMTPPGELVTAQDNFRTALRMAVELANEQNKLQTLLLRSSS